MLIQAGSKLPLEEIKVTESGASLRFSGGVVAKNVSHDQLMMLQAASKEISGGATPSNPTGRAGARSTPVNRL